MPSLEESIGVFEQMTNVASGFNESFLNSISAMEAIAPANMNLEISIANDNAAVTVNSTSVKKAYLKNFILLPQMSFNSI